VAAAAELGGLMDAGGARAWLYAAASAECYCRADVPAEEDVARRRQPGRHRLRRRAPVRLRLAGGSAVVTRAALAQSEPQEHEVTELSIRHGLSEAELVVVLCTFRGQGARSGLTGP
jgi:hypothetical protein